MTIRCNEAAAYDMGLLLDLTLVDAPSTQLGELFELFSILGLSMHVVATGTIVGVITMLGGNRESLADSLPPVADIAFAAISGAGTQLVDIGNYRPRFGRLSYAHTSGDGMLKVYGHAKGRAV